MARMNSAAEIIDLWPSRAELARDLDVSYQTISKWRARRSIPPVYWKRLLASASIHEIAGVSAMALVEAHAPDRDASVSAMAHSDAQALKSNGHFTRFRHLAVPRFASLEQVNAHIAALRDA